MKLRFAILALAMSILAACGARYLTAANPVYDTPVKPTMSSHGWSATHTPPPNAPTGAAAIGSPGTAKASFVDVTRQAGLHYQWTIPGPRPMDILQTIGNGCAFLDYNNDGNLDILLVGSKLALYKGDGHGHFTDVTHETGLDKFSGHFLGCAVGDYDNDGYEDIYISGYQTGLLLHNEKGRSFRDVTQEAGLKPQPWGTSAAWGDINNDGRLDLFVGNYVRYEAGTSKRLCLDKGKLDSCGPLHYGAEHGALFQNEGAGKFRDISSAWKPGGWGKTLGAAFADYNASGRQSLYLANDEEPGDLMKNVGAQFVDVGRVSGIAYDGRFAIHAGMGLDWGDYDNDGRLDLTVAAFQTEPKSVFHNLGTGYFEDRSDALTVGSKTRPYVAFGMKWLDYDNDGWLDLMIANGHVQDNIHEVDSSTTYRQPTQLFRNDRGRLFVDMSRAAGSALPRPIVGRGLAIGDYDNDGRVDALVVDSEGAPVLLHNESAPVGHWLSLKLVGTRSNRDGIGARVTVRAGGLTQTRFCHTDGSYLSASDVRVHLGLGKAAFAQTISVKWPSGHTDTFSHVRADQHLRLREGDKQLIRSSR